MLRVDKLSIVAGDFSLAGVSFEIATGAYAVMMGETGCGKTTLLETICGLRRPAAGAIHLGDRLLTGVPISQRRIGYVPQEGAVFPTMSVRQNLAFPQMVRGQTATAIDKQVEELAERLAIGHLLDRRATRLSGGEIQRVALGRALSSEPELLLFDEPLSALDETTRSEMLSLLKSVQAETGVTTLHVTHSRAEAEQVGEVLLTVTDGQVHQKTPASGRSASATNQDRARFATTHAGLSP